MIVFDLSCDHGHRFEGWFGSSGDFADQRARGLLLCPTCGSTAVDKAPMAPAVPKKGNAGGAKAPARTERHDVGVEAGADAGAVSNAPMPPAVAEAFRKLAAAQAEALTRSKWVGRDFAEVSRAIHYGEREDEAVHGEASLAEAQDLAEEGIAVTPLLVPVAPPDELN